MNRRVLCLAFAMLLLAGGLLGRGLQGGGGEGMEGEGRGVEVGENRITIAGEIEPAGGGCFRGGHAHKDIDHGGALGGLPNCRQRVRFHAALINRNTAGDAVGGGERVVSVDRRRHPPVDL